MHSRASLGRSILILVALVTLIAAPAAGQGLSWFYCYAPDASTGALYVSDVHAVGPVSERAAYASEFARYLTSRGKIPRGAQAYCVMRATEREIVRGQQSVTELCTECGEATRVEHVAWLRGGKRGRQLVATAPPIPTRAVASRSTKGSPRATDADAAKADESVGVFLMGRRDATAVVYTTNEENAQFLTRHKADLRGGKWTWLLLNDHCPGWAAVAYATNGSERHYFIARGSDFEGTARVAAIKLAEKYAAAKGTAWLAGVLASFKNQYREPGPDFSRGAIEGVKQEVRKVLVDPCADAKSTEYTTVGVRG